MFSSEPPFDLPRVACQGKGMTVLMDLPTAQSGPKFRESIKVFETPAERSDHLQKSGLSTKFICNEVRCTRPGRHIFWIGGRYQRETHSGSGLGRIVCPTRRGLGRQRIHGRATRNADKEAAGTVSCFLVRATMPFTAYTEKKKNSSGLK
jgi:hypothetical protein